MEQPRLGQLNTKWERAPWEIMPAGSFKDFVKARKRRDAAEAPVMPDAATLEAPIAPAPLVRPPLEAPPAIASAPVQDLRGLRPRAARFRAPLGRVGAPDAAGHRLRRVRARRRGPRGDRKAHVRAAFDEDVAARAVGDARRPDQDISMTC